MRRKAMTIALIKTEEAEQTDPLRVALAAAIEAEAEARSAVDTANENLRRGRAFVETAQAAVERAKALVEKAKEGDARRTAAAVRNRAGASPDASSTRSARAAAQSRLDDYEVAKGTIALLEQAVVESETALSWAVVDCLAARNAVLAPIARELIRLARDGRRTAAAAKTFLAEIFAERAGVPRFGDNTLDNIKAGEAVRAPLAELRSEAQQLFLSGSIAEERAAASAAEGEMMNCIARLATDATAEPPTL
jgi:hypothetical protein